MRNIKILDSVWTFRLKDLNYISLGTRDNSSNRNYFISNLHQFLDGQNILINKDKSIFLTPEYRTIRGIQKSIPLAKSKGLNTTPHHHPWQGPTFVWTIPLSLYFIPKIGNLFLYDKNKIWMFKCHSINIVAPPKASSH